MALLLGVSWLCLLLWGCICAVSQKGYNTAHGYKRPHTYNQFNRRESFTDNYEDKTKAMRQNGFVLLQAKPVFYKNGHHVGPVGGLRKDMLRSQPDFVHKAGKFPLTRVDQGDNEVWSKWGANNQILNEHHPFPAAADFSTSLISSSVYGKQDPPSAPYTQHGLASRQLFSNYKTSAGSPAINEGFFISISENKPVQSGYRQPGPMQFPLVSSGEEYSFSQHNVAHPHEHLQSPSQHFSYFSRKPKYTSHRKGSLVGDQMSSAGLKHHKGLHREHQVYVPSQQNPPASGLFLPRSQSFFANHVPKHRKKTAQSVRRESKKQRDRPSLPLTVTRPSSSHGSHCSYIKYHKADVDPSTWTALAAGDEKKSQLHKQNLNSALRDLNGHFKTKFRDRSSTWNSFDSHGAKNQLNSLSAADDRFLRQHGGYEDAVRAGLVKTKQPRDLQIFENMNKRTLDLASWPSELLSEPQVSDSKCVVWRNTKSATPKKSQKLLRSSVNAYIRSQKRSARAAAYLLKTCYKPYQWGHAKTGKHQWKLAVRQHM